MSCNIKAEVAVADSIEDSNSNSQYLADISCDSSNDAKSYTSTKPEQMVFTSRLSEMDNKSASERTAPLSKKQMKKLARQKRWQEERERYRAMKKEKRKKRKAELKEKGVENTGLTRTQIKKRRTEVEQSNIKVAIDFSFDHLMTEPNIKKILKQVENSYSINRRSNKPLQFYITSYNGPSKRLLLETRPGCVNWDVTFKEEDYMQVFEKSSIVYLTSDSSNVLDNLEDGKVYIIGGLVDHNQHKGLCYNLATEKGIATARLPIDEHIEMKTRKVLTVNHVFNILQLVAEGKTWTEALLSIIPQRKGAIAKDESADSKTVKNLDKSGQDGSSSNDKVSETTACTEDVEQVVENGIVDS